jgi:thiamine-monophosphate kinase
MLDISDGLLADLGHIIAESGVGAEVQLDALPLSKDFRDALKQNRQLIDLALSGGEDYQLLFTSREQQLDQLADFSGPITRIGRVSEGSEILVWGSDRKPYDCPRGGFDHFA